MASETTDGRLADEIAAQCVRDNPRVDAELQQAGDVDSVVADCMQDDGPCQASTECAGPVEGRECDSDHFIGAPAAACIARAHELEDGVQGLQAELIYNFSERRVIWNLKNVLEQGADGSARGLVVSVDAVSGELLETSAWAATP